LAAAIALAYAGLEVTVVEAGRAVGGAVSSAEVTLPEFIHDLCSAIHPLAVASPVLSQLPLERFGLRWIHPTIPVAHPLEDGPAAALHRGFAETAATLESDGKAYTRWLQPLSLQAKPLFADILQPLLSIPSHPILLARFGWHAIQSAERVARTLFQKPAARALVAGLAAHSFLALSAFGSASFAMALAIAGHAVGWPFPEGGAGALARAMEELLVSLGGKVETGNRVEKISDLPDGPLLFFDVSAAQFAKIAAARLPASYARQLARFRNGPGVFILDYALSQPIPWRDEACRQAGTVHVGGAFDEVAFSEREVMKGGHPERPFVLVAQQSLFDRTRAPEGRHTLWAYCHVPNGSTMEMSGRIEQQIERFAPGFRDCILKRHCQNTAALERRNANLVGGDISGGANNFRQLLIRPALRRAPYRTPVRGVYLCSSSTPPGGGVHGMCGWNAARVALKDFGIICDRIDGF